MNSKASLGLPQVVRKHGENATTIKAHLSTGLTGIFFSRSFPPFSKIKWLRFVLPPSPAPSAVISTRSGSDRSGYGSSFYKHRVE